MAVKGVEILQLVQEKDLRSLQPRQNLNDLSEVKRVIVFGSSGSGKSHLERKTRAALAGGALDSRISIPKRVVTRPPRPDDVDMVYCTAEELVRRVELDEVGLYGVKIMEGGRKEPFGYTCTPEGSLPVIFGNNAIVKHPKYLKPEGVLDGALLAVVYTPDAVRAQRIDERSSEMDREERAFRLSESESSDRMREHAHLVIENHGGLMTRTSPDFILFVNEVAKRVFS